MGLGKCTRWPFHDLDPRSWLWYRLAKIFLSARYSENHSFDHCNTWQHYCPKHGYITWLNFGVVLLETFILANFLYKIWICFFKVKHCFGHISGIVGPIDVKRKGSVSVRYWVQYVTFTFHLTRDLDLRCFKVKFQNNSISGIVGLIDVKWKRSELIWYWVNCMTLPFDHPHDLNYPRWLVWPWWGEQMYRIVTGVTWDIGVPSTSVRNRFEK